LTKLTESLQQENESLKTLNSNIQQEIQIIKESFSIFTSEINGLKTQITNLQQENQTQNTKITNFQQENQTQNTKIQSLSNFQINHKFISFPNFSKPNKLNWKQNYVASENRWIYATARDCQSIRAYVRVN
jgi:predicted nuclease with TOPRIM domain